MARCNLICADFKISSKSAKEDSDKIRLSDMVEMSGKAKATIEKSKRETVTFGFLQRVDSCKCKIVYCAEDRAYRGDLYELVGGKPLPDKTDPSSPFPFYHMRSCAKAGKIDDVIKQEFTATMVDFPGLQYGVEKCFVENGKSAPLRLIDSLIQFTTWVGYQVTSYDDGGNEKGRTLTLLKEWKIYVYYSYLSSRVAPHVNFVERAPKDGVSVNGDEIQKFLSNKIPHPPYKKTPWCSANWNAVIYPGADDIPPPPLT